MAHYSTKNSIISKQSLHKEQDGLDNVARDNRKSLSHIFQSPINTSTKDYRRNNNHERHVDNVGKLPRKSFKLDEHHLASKRILSLVPSKDFVANLPVAKRPDSKSNEIKEFSLIIVTWSCIFLCLLFGAAALCHFYINYDARNVYSVDYTLCNNTNTNETCYAKIAPQMSFSKPIRESCRCRFTFNVDDQIPATQINIYYRLTNFYQNYRFLVQSRDDVQLSGDLTKKPGYRCIPNESDGKPIAPCGGLANIMFDDEFRLYTNITSNLTMFKKDLPFPGSRLKAYKNPEDFSSLNLHSAPPRWTKHVVNLDEIDKDNNGLQNGHFIEWMNVATFNDVVKLYGIYKPPTGRLESGQYMIEIDYRYVTDDPDFSKKLIQIDVVGPLGVKNSRLIIVCGTLGVIHFVIFIITFLSWKKWAYLGQGLYPEP